MLAKGPAKRSTTKQSLATLPPLELSPHLSSPRSTRRRNGASTSLLLGYLHQTRGSLAQGCSARELPASRPDINAGIQEVIDLGIAPTFVEFLALEEEPDLVVEAAHMYVSSHSHELLSDAAAEVPSR